eukprot:1636329-Amphidinium_carterae.1
MLRCPFDMISSGVSAPIECTCTSSRIASPTCKLQGFTYPHMCHLLDAFQVDAVNTHYSECLAELGPKEGSCIYCEEVF